MPANFEAFRRNLSTIPPTPAQDDEMDPFDTSAAPPVPALPDMAHVLNEPMAQQSLVESIWDTDDVMRLTDTIFLNDFFLLWIEIPVLWVQMLPCFFGSDVRYGR
jgi:hypothetical protein